MLADAKFQKGSQLDLPWCNFLEHPIKFKACLEVNVGQNNIFRIVG